MCIRFVSSSSNDWAADAAHFQYIASTYVSVVYSCRFYTEISRNEEESKGEKKKFPDNCKSIESKHTLFEQQKKSGNIFLFKQ